MNQLRLSYEDMIYNNSNYNGVQQHIGVDLAMHLYI
jgi:hypothetical protein